MEVDLRLNHIKILTLGKRRKNSTLEYAANKQEMPFRTDQGGMGNNPNYGFHRGVEDIRGWDRTYTEECTDNLGYPQTYHGAAARTPNFRPLLETRDPMGSLTISQALKMIPLFDVNPDMLATFCQGIRNVLDVFGPSSERWILSTLASKFRGRAAEGFTTRLTQYASVERLVVDMNLQYGHIRGADQTLSEIKVVKQKPDESAGSYGQRVEILLNRLQNSYDTDRSLLDFERFTFKKRGQRKALEQFLFGLKGELQHQVRASNASILREAVMEAVRIEQKTGVGRGESTTTHNGPDQAISAETVLKELVTKISSLNVDTLHDAKIRLAPARYACSHCNMTNHQTEECRKKNTDSKLCEFCNIRGHTYEDCYSLRQALRDGRVSKEKTEKNSETTPPANQTPVFYTAYPVPVPPTQTA